MGPVRPSDRALGLLGSRVASSIPCSAPSGGPSLGMVTSLPVRFSSKSSRHMGQERLPVSHSSMHLAWNMWRQGSVLQARMAEVRLALLGTCGGREAPLQVNVSAGRDLNVVSVVSTRTPFARHSREENT